MLILGDLRTQMLYVMAFIGKLLAFCVPCPLGTGDWKWCRGESVFDFHTVKRSATLGDSKVMMHSPLTEKGSASKRDFLRSNLPIISHHSSIRNFFSYRKQNCPGFLLRDERQQTLLSGIFFFSPDSV